MLTCKLVELHLYDPRGFVSREAHEPLQCKTHFTHGSAHRSFPNVLSISNIIEKTTICKKGLRK